MRQIKIVHKGACRYVATSDAARLDKFIRDGWEPARDDNGNLIIRELGANRDTKNISTKTSDILAAINQAVEEAESNVEYDLDDLDN